jgi:hypothetical protein
MDPLTPDEHGGDVAANDHEAALDGRERDADARDRAADRRDDIAAKREVLLDHREDAVQALLAAADECDHSQKSVTVEQTNATQPQKCAPSLPRRGTRWPGGIVGGQPRTATSPASIAIAVPVTVPISWRGPVRYSDR